MIFKELFEQRFSNDFGFSPRMIGLAPITDEDGVWYQVDVEDPYETPDTRLCVLLDCMFCEPEERKQGQYMLTKPHEDYSYEERYKFIIHQLKYMVVDRWLSGGFENPELEQYDILFYPGKLNKDVFAGIDKQTNRAVHIDSGGIQVSFSFLLVNTHAEDGCLGMQPSNGVVALPVGTVPGMLIYTKIEHLIEQIHVKIVRLDGRSPQLLRYNESLCMNDKYKDIKHDMSNRVDTPWDHLIHSRHDVYRNPNNKEIWHLLTDSMDLYDGHDVFTSKNGSMELTYAKISDEWVPVDKEWLLKYPTKVFKQAADELLAITNITVLAESTSLQ